MSDPACFKKFSIMSDGLASNSKLIESGMIDLELIAVQLTQPMHLVLCQVLNFGLSELGEI